MPAKQMTPLVIDLSHHNEIDDWTAVYASGIRGVIHKATQGGGMVDTTYASRRKAALAAGLLFGAYHFGDNSDVAKQVDNFLKVAKPDDKTLLCLDYEPNGARTMSLEQAKQFLQLVFDRTGQKPVLYSGNLIKEQMKTADAFICSHRLWLAQYGATPKLPKGWSKYWLWQYSGDGVNGAGIIPGIKTKGIDRNVFGGTDLAAEWVHKPTPPRSDEVAESSSPVLGASTLDLIDAGDLASQSRKVGLLMQLRKWAMGLGIGGTGLSFADINDQASQLHQLMQTFKDNAWLILIGGLFVGGALATLFLTWTHQDYAEGRYKPSKGA